MGQRVSAEESRATEWLLADAQASEQLGAVLARTAAAAAQAWAERALIVFLCGDLGAGKTTLARGVLRELGVTGTVRSPSYTLLERYETPTAVGLHVDLYRLRGDEEVEALGLRDELRAGVIVLVEFVWNSGPYCRHVSIGSLSSFPPTKKSSSLGLRTI